MKFATTLIVLALIAAGCARDHAPTTKTVATKGSVPIAEEGAGVYGAEYAATWWIVAEDGTRARVSKADYDAARVGGEIQAEWE